MPFHTDYDSYFFKSWNQIRWVSVELACAPRVVLFGFCHHCGQITRSIALPIFYGSHYVVQSTTSREALGVTKHGASNWQSEAKESKGRRLTPTSSIMSCYPSATSNSVCISSVCSSFSTDPWPSPNIMAKLVRQRFLWKQGDANLRNWNILVEYRPI